MKDPIAADHGGKLERCKNGRVLEYDFHEGGRYRIELTYGDGAAMGMARRAGL
jgi:hypothetical protein